MRAEIGPIAMAIGAAIVAGGIGVGGYLAGKGVLLSRLEDRVVTVKGVAELEMQADLAVLPIAFSVTAPDVKGGMARLDAAAQIVSTFLQEQGFSKEEITFRAVEMRDTMTEGSARSEARFVLTQRANARTTDIANVERAGREVGELARRGVVLNWSTGPAFYVTAGKLTEVKPGLIREATERAKVAAEEFAAVSGARVGAIRRANQGVIAVLPRDETGDGMESGSPDKRIRAVTTVDYQLERK
jgi:uncharacterized protein